jgi:hypothetical protein
MTESVSIKKSTRDKKFMAVFSNTDSNRTNTVHFGARGMSD